MKTRTLVPITLTAVAVVYLLVTLLASLLGWVMAHADAGAGAPAPATGTPLAKYGWWAGVLVLYAGVRWLLRRNETEHWIAHGRTLSIATAVLSVIGSIVGWRFGMDPETITLAVAGAVPLAIPSTVTASSAPPGETR